MKPILHLGLSLLVYTYVSHIVPIASYPQLGTGSDLFSSGGITNTGGKVKLDEQMAAKVRAIIKHFKQDDPKGIPSEMGNLIPDPMPVPRQEQTMSGMKMKFENLNVYGLSKFRLEHVRILVSELKIAAGLSIDELLVMGNYSMSSWINRSKGPFNVTITKVFAEAEVELSVNEDGILEVEKVNMDIKFEDMKMNFENLGILGSFFQSMINSVGGFLFDSIKPMILQEVETNVRGELNRQARSVPQQFPNSITPIDMFLASSRIYMREKGLDPFALPDYQVPSWTTFNLSEGVLYGLSTIYRSGAIKINFEENIVKVTIHLGAENLKGKYNWTWSIMQNMYARKGSMEFNIEYITAEVKVSQPANLDKPASIDGIDLELGNIAVLSDGAGTADYIVEAAFNIAPNLFRKQIIDAIEEPLRKAVQLEVRKAFNAEQLVEEHLF